MKKLFPFAFYTLFLIQITSVHAMTGLNLKDECYIKHTGFISIGNQSLYYRSPAIYFNNESTLYRNVLSLNNEFGFNFDYFNHPRLVQTKIFNLYTSIAVEPRWYYNKERRRNIELNHPVRYSPFLSFKINAFLPLGLSYYSYPDYDKIYFQSRILPNRLAVSLPRWGAQGNIADLFYYEFGLGVIYFHRFNADVETKQRTMTRGFLPDLFLRVGVRIY